MAVMFEGSLTTALTVCTGSRDRKYQSVSVMGSLEKEKKNKPWVTQKLSPNQRLNSFISFLKQAAAEEGSSSS